MTENDLLKEKQLEIPQSKIPMANTTLVLAIVSVIGCIFYGIPGIILALIAIVLHKRVKEVYKTDPVIYQQSYNTARAGWIIAIISLLISIGTTIYTVYVFYVLWYVVPETVMR
jgi:archaellum biogenesis protein FlaJ (TadC family)